MTLVLVAIATVLIAVAAHDLVRRPVLRRQAIRNLVRRPGETGLMIGGALLGTAIITASLVVGDTVASTVRDVARTNLGPIDEALTTDDLEVADQAWDALSASPPVEVDGLIRATGTRVAVSRDGIDADANSLADTLADTSVWAFELDFDDARAFAANAPSGFEQAGSTPGPGEVAVSEPLAATLGAAVGDTVAVHAYGRSTELRVVAVTPRVGLGGRATDNVHLAPGTLDDLFDAVRDSNPDAAPPGRYIYISNQGGVFDSAAATDAVIEWASGALADAGIDGDKYDLGRWKADLLEDADAEGAEFTTIFSSIGAFAVISGMLLLVNIVAMLTEERRNQLGILRALGLRRGQVVRLMALEGTAYAVASAAIGVAVGIGVGWVVAGLTAQVFEQDRLNLVFTVERSSLVTAAATGLVLTLAAVWLASTRLARMNVIAAIRDLDQPRTTRRRRATVAGAAGLLLAGLLALLVGAGSNSPVPALVSVPLACAGLGLGAYGAIGQRAAATLAGLTSIAWGIGVFSALPDAMDNPEISVFVFQGVVLVSGAVAVATANQSVWEAALRRFGSGRRGLALRLGLAYPLARPIRSALLLAMFSLVIFTITFMAVLVAVFDSEADSIANQTAAGFDVIVETSRNSPAQIEELRAVDGVAAVAPLDRRWFEVQSPSGRLTDRPMTAVDRRYLEFGGAEMSSHSPEFDSTEDVWEAVLSDPNLIVVDEFLFGDAAMRPGDVVTFEAGDEGTADFVVAGVLRADWLWNAVYASPQALARLDPEPLPPSRYFVAAEPGRDADGLAASLNGALLQRGIDARSVGSIIEEELDQQNSFIRILQGYLGLGLLIGVAGLGIVLIRAVRERRREIGTLRAIGYPAQTIRSAFLVEAAFVSLQGAAIGVGLGLVTAWQVVTNVDAFAAGSMAFVVPAGLIFAIATAPVLASLAAAAFPARRAAKIAPAVALRITG